MVAGAGDKKKTSGHKSGRIKAASHWGNLCKIFKEFPLSVLFDRRVAGAEGEGATSVY